jgi:hypothetical protein
MPTIIGSTTDAAKAVATAASATVPPAESICSPAAAAIGWFAETTAWDAITGCLRVGIELMFKVQGSSTDLLKFQPFQMFQVFKPEHLTHST